MTGEFRERMYGVLDLYEKPCEADEPVVCLDEKSKQLLGQTRRPRPTKPGVAAKEDYECQRAGTRNIFVAVEPTGGRHRAVVTARRTKVDFVNFVGTRLNSVYAGARKIHLVLDNLNTHFRGSFVDVLGAEPAAALLARVEFHYTPKHASWLNLAEIEMGVLERQCLGQRMGTEALMPTEVAAWEHRRNQEKATIEWQLTRQVADQKLSRHYVSSL